MGRERAFDILGVAALVAMLILVFVLAFTLSGCRSTGALPCPEKPIDVVGRDVPVPCIVVIEPLPGAELPPLPPYPHDADEQELKAWALALGEAVEARSKIMLARDAAWLAKVTEHNNGTKKCSDIRPVP